MKIVQKLLQKVTNKVTNKLTQKPAEQLHPSTQNALPQPASASSDADAGAQPREQGDRHLHRGDYTEAVQCYRLAVEFAPDDAKAHCKLGFALNELGQAEEARSCLARALSIDPANADAHYLLGTLYRSDHQFDRALEHFRIAIALTPDFENAYLDTCLLLVQLKRPEEAAQLMTAAIKHIPTSAHLHFYLGNVQHELDQLDPALASFRQAVSLQPDHAQAWGNLGIVLLKQDDAGSAVDAFQTAIKLDPNYVDAHNNLGNALLQFNRFDEAMASYKNGLAINPGSERLIYNRGLLSLLFGDFESGWRDYEYRWYRTEQTTPRNFSQPLWLNDIDLAGRRILLHAEQGIGDAIQFCRYVEQVVALGPTVFLEVHPQIKSLMQLLPGVAAVVAMGEALPEFDCHCPFASLPLAFHANFDTIPAMAPYLHAPKDRVLHWEQQLQAYRKPRIGVVWAGGVLLKNDRNRSIKLETFAQILHSEKYQFFSLQKDLRAGDKQILDCTPGVQHLGSHLTDFAETAALVSNLDLVISVDTSVAHLAGALNTPVWILLPYSPDFRWLLDRSDSPWYTSARLFRQPARGDWESVMQMLDAALEVYFEKHAGGHSES